MPVSSAPDRRLILHADDYGMNPSVNSGILKAFREGLLTSTSLLVNSPDTAAACAEWPKLIQELGSGALPSLGLRQSAGDERIPFDLGIHLNLTQGRPLTKDYPDELLDHQGRFPGIGSVFRRLLSPESKFRDKVRAELELQFTTMISLGVRPSHINGHQYIELIPGISELIPSLADQFQVRVVRLALEPHLTRTLFPELRLTTWGLSLVKQFYARRFRGQLAGKSLVAPQQFFGTSHAGLVTLRTLRKFLSYPSRGQWTEVGLHPAVEGCQHTPQVSDGWNDPLAAHRPQELAWLCASKTVDLLNSQGFKLGRLSSMHQ